MLRDSQLSEWTALTAASRGEGPALAAGLIDAATLNTVLARHGLARACVSLAAGKRVWTTFEPGSSHADVRECLVNTDADLLRRLGEGDGHECGAGGEG